MKNKQMKNGFASTLSGVRLLLVFAVVSLVPASAQTLAYYNFSTDGSNGSTPSTLHDTSGNGYNISATGGNLGTIHTAVQPSWSSFPSLQLPNGGIAGYEPANATPFNAAITPASSFTIEMSINMPSLSANYFLSTVDNASGNSGQNGFYSQTGTPGVWSIVSRKSGGGSLTDPTSLSAGTWYALAITYNGSGTLDMYVNQTLVASNTSFSFNANTTYGFVLGQFKDTTGVNNLLEYNQIRFSDAVLSPSQMLGPTPEPSSIALFGLAGAFILAIRYRRRARQA